MVKVIFICKKGSPNNNIWMSKDDSGSTQLKIGFAMVRSFVVALQTVDMYGNLKLKSIME